MESIIKIRVSAADKAAYEAAAKHYRISLSAWARMSLASAYQHAANSFGVPISATLKVGDTVTYHPKKGAPQKSKIIAVATSAPKKKGGRK